MLKIIKNKEQIEGEVLNKIEPIHRKLYFLKPKELNEEQKKIRQRIQNRVQGRLRWQNNPYYREKKLKEQIKKSKKWNIENKEKVKEYKKKWLAKMSKEEKKEYYKKYRKEFKLLVFLFQILNLGYKIKTSKIIDYSVNNYVMVYKLVKNEGNIH